MKRAISSAIAVIFLSILFTGFFSVFRSTLQNIQVSMSAASAEASVLAFE